VSAADFRLGMINSPKAEAFLSEGAGIAADEDERPEWQLAIAASLANPENDPESAIRNLKQGEEN